MDKWEQWAYEDYGILSPAKKKRWSTIEKQASDIQVLKAQLFDRERMIVEQRRALIDLESRCNELTEDVKLLRLKLELAEAYIIRKNGSSIIQRGPIQPDDSSR